jgi:hypothetical protein
MKRRLMHIHNAYKNLMSSRLATKSTSSRVWCCRTGLCRTWSWMRTPRLWGTVQSQSDAIPTTLRAIWEGVNVTRSSAATLKVLRISKRSKKSILTIKMWTRKSKKYKSTLKSFTNKPGKALSFRLQEPPFRTVTEYLLKKLRRLKISQRERLEDRKKLLITWKNFEKVIFIYFCRFIQLLLSFTYFLNLASLKFIF